MNHQVMEKFRKDYPLLMIQEDGSFTRFGFECGPGWLPLIYELFGFLEDLQRTSGKAVRVSQVKEKFGSLRVYMGCDNALSDDVDLLETLFESLSVRVCDVCGSPGRIEKTKGGYVCTRCPDHRESSQEAVEKASQKTCERFLSYEREGIDCSGFVFVSAGKSAVSEGLGFLVLREFPDRLISVSESLMAQLETSEHRDVPVSDLAGVISGLKDQGKTLMGYTDGSTEGNVIMGRPW